ncbi:RNA-directed DNA polymerase from mobile element jockey [Trichonephila clavipes]|nr:RNA-directed DNA polymerase from mobile element jockey [Trichonephila clavipes]
MTKYKIPRPTEEFISDNAAAIYLSFSNSERPTQPALARSPLFHPPETSTATFKAALDKIVARVTSKRKKAAAPTENNTSDNTSNVPKSLVKRETRKRATVDEDGFRLPSKKQTANPNGKPFLSSPAAILTHPNSSAPSALPIILSNAHEEVEDTEFDTEQAAAAVAPRVKIPPFFIQPNPDWTDLMVFAHSLAPTLQSKLSGRFLRITVQSEEEYRKLVTYFWHEQIAFKYFMLRSERPLKLILRGLPTSTELEAVKKEIESEGFKIHKISRLTKFQSKAPMPLICIQLINDLNADSIYNYVDMFGNRVAFEPYDGSRNRRPNQCWRCQGFFHSSEVCHLPMKCLKCAGPHQAKDCTLHFEDPLKCARS